ncbi:hypothetical protein IV203_028069 [Nitzschia inconspicua]|uniref:Uncharacterized protein n=1 Tax=Nitzschia inconspicua TaxID=303405 RepID=A0A9K3LYF3_9STRA|nr:hypothetical protein IV203_028069 [Nitzschia inconspicua]
MTLPPFFPSPASAPLSTMDSNITNEVDPSGIKPRISREDEAAHLLLSMSNLVSKELSSEKQRNTECDSSYVSSLPHEDSHNEDDDGGSRRGSRRCTSSHHSNDISQQKEVDVDHPEHASSSSTSQVWKNNPRRTVSIDEDTAAASPPPPVEFVDLKYKMDSTPLGMFSGGNFHTPRPSFFQHDLPHYHRMLHRPAVITPVRTMGRPVVNLPSNVSVLDRPTMPALVQSLSAFWPPAPPQHQQRFDLDLDLERMASQTVSRKIPVTSSPPPPPVELEIPQSFPKLPPLLSMKRDKMRHRNLVVEQQQKQEQQQQELHIQQSMETDNSVTSEEEDNNSSHDCDGDQEKRDSFHQRPFDESGILTTRKGTPKCSTSTLSSINATKSPQRKFGKKFSWKNYPELEDFLIANRPEYLRHSAQNYTLEQKDYNNTLTARLIDYADQCGYGNLLDHKYKQDFGSFTAIRDRIRGYFKSFLQSSRRREQRRQKRIEKQRQQQLQTKAAAAIATH